MGLITKGRSWILVTFLYIQFVNVLFEIRINGLQIEVAENLFKVKQIRLLFKI